MTMSRDYALRYIVETPEEQEARRKDPTWRRMHDFVYGFGWARGDDARVFLRDCPDFESRTVEEKEAVWQSVKAKQEEEAEWNRAHPVKIGPFDTFQMPVIKAAFSTDSIADLVG